MDKIQLSTVTRFADVADPNSYVPLPDDWVICISDVVDSTTEMEKGRYKAVNFVGAATICAASNALDGDLQLFAFGGDGAGLAVPPEQAEAVSDAVARTSRWAERELGLRLRVGVVAVSDVRAAGYDVTAAWWRASGEVRYAMFNGGGMKWAAARLKAGALRYPELASDEDPDLTGLSCQWGPIKSARGSIVSLIVKRGPAADARSFARTIEAVIALLEHASAPNPVPAEGPEVRLRREALALQGRIPAGETRLLRTISTLLFGAFAWTVFKLSLPVGRFKPNRYRREIARNSDYRKFDDGLLITVDCSDKTIEALRQTLDAYERKGEVRYGMHLQDEALVTCIAPSVTTSDHVHFIDGAGGGYASAAGALVETNGAGK